jgi:hypothetical protein
MHSVTYTRYIREVNIQSRAVMRSREVPLSLTVEATEVSDEIFCLYQFEFK